MQYLIQERRATVGGNPLLYKRLSRREAAAFAEAMKAAGEDEREMERVGLELVGRKVTFEDGSPLCVDDVPADDLVEILRLVVGGERRSVADFTGTP